ncbi:MAG: hypothetical protein LKI92_09110 [Schleiferilactobacillus harbinensis]|nr:hypothetical protein [Schleiferilactobacillus harbinensis]MCI1913721.1 hypothetical protein [Schleiferilactobacillus harbinensis]
MKKILLKLLVLLSLGMVSGTALTSPGMALNPQPVVAADTPLPPNEQSRGGWALSILGLTWFIINGITSQPADANFVKGEPKKISLASTYDKKIIFNSNEVTGVQTRIYRNGTWQTYSAAPTIVAKAPTANISVDLGSGLDVGTYYFQFAVNYSGGGGTAYSRVVKVTIAAEPKDATAISLVPERPTIFWGESTNITAQLQPTTSTSPVKWSPVSEDLGKLAVLDGLITDFASKITPTDAQLRHDSGLPVDITATATNTVQSGTVTGSTQITIGGLKPKTATAGLSFSYTPEAYTDLTFPEGAIPSYQWTVYDANYAKVTTTAVLNNPSFSWANVKQPTAGDHYYLQLNITVPSSAGNATWRSNYAPLTVIKPQARLVAVPNLRFAKFVNGAAVAPTVRDFLQPTGLTLSYFPLAGQTGKNTFDGNNSGFLAVQTQGPKWSLSVSASTFVHETNVALATTPTLTLGLPSSNVSVPANGTPVVLFTNQTGDLTYTFYNNTRLQIPKTGSILAGRYQSQLTWTLTQAP